MGSVWRATRLPQLPVDLGLPVIIADFGFSKNATDRLLTTFCGSHEYAAPEVYYGNKNGYGPSVDIWSAGVIMLGFIFDRPAPPAVPKTNRRSALQRWNKRWAEILVKKVDDLDEDGDQVMDILIHMVRIKPEERSTVDECLERGCANGLFRRRHDGHIVNADDASEVNTLENETSDHTPDDDAADEGTTTPTQQSTQGIEISGDDASCASTILDGDLWVSVASSAEKLSNSPSGQLTLTGSSNSGPPARRQRTSYSASWSLTVGPSNSDSDGGFSLGGGDRNGEGKVTNLFIRRDRFTGSLESRQSAVEDDPGESWGGSSQGILRVPESEPEIATAAGMASFEQRVLELQA